MRPILQTPMPATRHSAVPGYSAPGWETRTVTLAPCRCAFRHMEMATMKSSWQAMRWVTVKVRAIIPTQAVSASKAIFPTAIAGLHLIRSTRHEKRTSLHTASMLMQKRDTAISVPAVGTQESTVSATRALSHRQARALPAVLWRGIQNTGCNGRPTPRMILSAQTPPARS